MVKDSTDTAIALMVESPYHCSSVSDLISPLFRRLQNIPGLDAPTWSRSGGIDEQSELEEELKAEKEWRKQANQQQVKFTPTGSSSSSVGSISCDLLVVACGMMASSFLGVATDMTKLQEIGRFTVSASPISNETTDTNTKKVNKDAAFILARSPAAPNTIFAFNYLRITASQYFQLTIALFERVTPKEVLLFDTLPQGSFISTERPLPCPPLIRRLQSSHFLADSAATKIDELEAPNLVFGYAASLLTHCEVHRLPAQLFVSVESRHYMVECYQAFEIGLAAAATSANMKLALDITKPFLSSTDASRTKSYKAAIAALQVSHGYTAGSDSSIRETAAQVTRDNRDSMFY